MIGDGYWSTGITVTYTGDDRHGASWAASADFYDNGFVGDDDPDGGIISTEGKIHTRYAVKGGDSEACLAAAINAIKADAERLGVRFRTDAPVGPYVYYRGDGEDEDWPPPAGWREMLTAQAERLGWRTLYAASATECES